MQYCAVQPVEIEIADVKVGICAAELEICASATLAVTHDVGKRGLSLDLYGACVDVFIASEIFENKFAILVVADAPHRLER